MAWPDLVNDLHADVIGEFAVTVEYERLDGTTLTPLGVFDAEGVRVDLSSGVALASSSPRLGVRLVSIVPPPEVGDVWRASGKSYRVVEILPSGDGWLDLIGEEQ